MNKKLILKLRKLYIKGLLTGEIRSSFRRFKNGYKKIDRSSEEKVKMVNGVLGNDR